MNERQAPIRNNNVISGGSLNLEIAILRQKLENRERDFADLSGKHQQALNEHSVMEEQLELMKEKVKKADDEVSAIRAESEAALRQNEADQQELAMMRRRSLVGGGGQIITQMYETILMRYEELKVTHEELQKKLMEETDKRVQVERQLNDVQLQEHDPEKEQLLSQNEFLNDEIEKLKRDVCKHLKDLARIRDERIQIKREYSLVMSERDAVHKDMDELQEALSFKQRENENLQEEKNLMVEEKAKLESEIINLQQTSASSLDLSALREKLFAAQQERKQALMEKEDKVHEAYNNQKAHAQAVEKIEKLSVERDHLRSKVELVQQQLDEAVEETKATTKWRELAFSERDKLKKELEESRRVCLKLTEEREALIKQLEIAVKERDSMKEAKKSLQVKVHEMQTRGGATNLEGSESAHSRDSAIDSGNWETEPSDMACRFTRVTLALPKQYDVGVELGCYIKHSNVPGVNVGDRVAAIDDVTAYDRTLDDVKRQLLCNAGVRLQLIKHLSPQRAASSAESSHDELHGNTSSQKNEGGGRPDHDCVWTGDNARVRLRVKRQTPIDPISSPVSPQQLQSPVGSPEQRVSIIYNNNGNSEIQARSELTNEAAKSNLESSSKKKKPKIGSSRFNWRKKKAKSMAISSPAGVDPGGTWPRLDSPPLNNHALTGGGRLSVFARKKNRPSISSSTFTPPEGHSAGHTPPTPVRVQLAVSPNSPLASPPQSPPSATEVTTISPSKATGVLTSKPRHRPQPLVSHKKKRPLSAPLGLRTLSMWQHPALQSAVDPPTAVNVSARDTSSLSHSVASRASVVEAPINSSPDPAPAEQSPVLFNRSARVYQRQRSTPATTQHTMSISPKSFNTSSIPASSNRHRNANSLPRPPSASSKGPSFSVASHGSKSKTLDCQRIRIPSEVSVGMILSGSEKGSINLSSDRSTNFLYSSAEQTHVYPHTTPSASQTGSFVSSISITSSTLSTRSRRPRVSTKPRYVTMVKGTEPIGISIVSGERGGIFVSRLTDNSLALKAGLEYGDQLLEYNGVNLRNAKEEQARVIMSQTHPGDNIKLLAQYNLEKYKQSIESNLSDTLGVAKPIIQNGSATPEERESTITPDLTPRASPHVEDTLRAQLLTNPRYVFLQGACSHIKLVGGNQVGIFVAACASNDETNEANNLKVGDQVIEVNSVSFNNITLEAAYILLNQCHSSPSFQVKYEPSKYKQIYGTSGDHFYVRALFDHVIEQDRALIFSRNSILLVENTFPDYVTGQWIASLVDEQGGRSTRGRIPSKLTVEKERENASHLDDVTSTAGSSSGKRLSGSGRRSFFKRLKPHRTSSRSSGDVRLQKSPSQNSLESTAETLSESLGAYQVVEKYSSANRRPVVVFGSHSSVAVEKLTREHTNHFVKCCLSSIDQGSLDSDVIDTYNYVTATRVLTGQLLRETITQFPQRHVLLEISLEAIDRLYSIEIYPIIVFIKYPSAKKIKESQERVVGREKVTMKQCKEMLEKQAHVEQTLLSKYYGTVVINGGPASTLATKISKVVSHEHLKVLWLPSKASLLNY